MQLGFWVLAGALVAVAVIAGFADRRRWRRKDMDRVGWVNWPLVQMLALIGAVMAGILAAHG